MASTNPNALGIYDWQQGRKAGADSSEAGRRAEERVREGSLPIENYETNPTRVRWLDFLNWG